MAKGGHAAGSSIGWCDCPGDALEGSFGRGRERELKEAALAEGAFRPDAAAMLLDDAAAEGKAEAGASERAGVRGVALLEALEDPLQFFLGDAAALILDLKRTLPEPEGLPERARRRDGWRCGAART